MNQKKYDALVSSIRLEALARQEGEIRAAMDGRRASVERLTADLEQKDVPARYRQEMETEIARLTAEIREGIREADLMRKLARPLLSEDKPLEVKPQHDLADVIFTLEGKAVEDSSTAHDAEFKTAIALLKKPNHSLEEAVAARALLQGLSWCSPGDSYAMAALRVLDGIIAERRLAKT